MAKIDTDYKAMLDVAKKMKTIVGNTRLRKRCITMKTFTIDLDEAWKSEGYKAHKAAMEAKRKKFEELIGLVEKYVILLENSAKKYASTVEKNINLAKSL